MNTSAKLYIFGKEDMPAVLDKIGQGGIVKSESGAPHFDAGNLKMSLSHKDELVVIAVAECEVGVDMENVTVPRNYDKMTRLFDSTEKPASLIDFYRLWTAKEAVAKLAGTGITREILQTKTQDVIYKQWGDYLICVAGVTDAEFAE